MLPDLYSNVQMHHSKNENLRKKICRNLSMMNSCN